MKSEGELTEAIQIIAVASFEEREKGICLGGRVGIKGK